MIKNLQQVSKFFGSKLLSKNKYRIGFTKMISVRLDSDVYSEAKSIGLNFSLAINVLLREYLYIQKHSDDSHIVFGKSNIPLSDIAVDVFNRRML